jgi:LmbE family N-acetylglucosaminyl deacetylase
MLIAPHPDDEALACSIILQHALQVGALIRIIYATDGDDNPWPQRMLERKWRLSAADRKRWGKLRRAEAVAALGVLGVRASDARFLALPDQGLTDLLIRDCRSALDRLAKIIRDWSPTHLLVPSTADTHPDHSALGVILRLALAQFFPNEPRMSVWSYAVHGKSRSFFGRAQKLQQSETETATKLRAIRCHRTQIKLSRRRFLGYAARPERFLELQTREAATVDGSIHSISRQPHVLRLKVRLSVKPMRAAEPFLFILGSGAAGTFCVKMQLPVRSSHVQMFDCVTERGLDAAEYRGNAFAGELTVPVDIFSPGQALFVKLERRSWFFDEAGWLEVPASVGSEQIALPTAHLTEKSSPFARQGCD